MLSASLNKTFPSFNTFYFMVIWHEIYGKVHPDSEMGNLLTKMLDKKMLFIYTFRYQTIFIDSVEHTVRGVMMLCEHEINNLTPNYWSSDILSSSLLTVVPVFNMNIMYNGLRGADVMAPSDHHQITIRSIAHLLVAGFFLLLLTMC